MKGDKKKVAIFKPRDEEAYAPNNPSNILNNN